MPWDWTHRYPLTLPSDRPYVPGCNTEVVTVPGRGGDRSVDIARAALRNARPCLATVGIHAVDPLAAERVDMLAADKVLIRLQMRLLWMAFRIGLDSMLVVTRQYGPRPWTCHVRWL